MLFIPSLKQTPKDHSSETVVRMVPMIIHDSTGFLPFKPPLPKTSLLCCPPVKDSPGLTDV